MSTETKFTKGPWECGPARNYTGYYIAPRHRLPTLAAVKDESITVFNFPGQTQANAHLIAAAPELYEVLEAAQEELRLIRMKDTDAVYDPTLKVRMSAALAKARGEL